MNYVKVFLQTGQMEKSLSIMQKQWLARKAELFTMNNDLLYIMGQNNRLRRCLSNTKAQKGDEGVAWRNNIKTLCNQNHVEEDF